MLEKTIFFSMLSILFPFSCSVLIFEVTEPNFPEEEAVRVFVQFTTQQAAAAALAHLHGRFFGGRVVRGKYYDEARFEAGDLAPRPDEVA